MKFFRKLLPHLTISLNLALLVVIYLDLRNPTMGFLVGAPFLALVGAACVCSILTGILFYSASRRRYSSNPGKYPEQIAKNC